MRYVIQNFIMFTKVKDKDKPNKKNEWKRDRKIARKNKLMHRRIAA